ncbi:MAG: methyl-accepting chemotaxis protein [Clostridiales bacterium]|nr:methyl-accepting chemotaxis protein [Clostridiales bacterium]
MKRFSIKMAIALPVLAVLILGVAAMSVVVGIVASSSTDDLTSRIIDARVQQYANEFNTIATAAYSTVQGLVPAIDTLQETSVSPRTRIIQVLEKTLQGDPSILAVWTGWEPDALDGNDSEYVNADAYHDGTGRFVPYLYRDGTTITGSPMENYDDPIEGMYYWGAKQSQKPYISDPYTRTFGGITKNVYTIAIPILRDGAAVGVVGMDISLDELAVVMNAASILDDGYLCTISPSGIIATHRNADMVLEGYDVAWLKNYSSNIERVLSDGGDFNVLAFSDVTNTNMQFLGKGIHIAGTDQYWLICGFVPEATVNRASNELLTWVIGMGAGLIVIVAFITYLLVSGSLKRLPSITDMAGKVAAGDIDFDIDIDQRSTKNEITLLERSFAAVVSVLKNLIGDINEMGRALKVDGDIDVKLREDAYSGAYRAVAGSVNGIALQLINEVLDLLKCLEAYGDGDFNASVPPLPGKKVILNKAVDRLSGNLKSVSRDIEGLVTSAIHGKLSNRVDVTAYKGDWAVLLTDMNHLMETIVAPINEASEVMKLVAAGSFERKMDGDYQGDFLIIKDSINNTVTNIASYIDEIAQVLTQIADHKLNREIKREYVGEFSVIKDALNNITDTLNHVIGDMNAASEQVASGARQISESSMTLAQGATEQASAVEELTATVMSVNEKTRHNAGSAVQATELADELKGYAMEGNSEMKNMLRSMLDISEASNSISRIIDIIRDISLQTNLLALNASIEAAHAGVHGAGFSVVAEEVRSLAVKSQEAANSTTGLIETSIQRVNEGTLIAEKTDKALERIVSGVDAVSGIISDISAASNEQAEALAQINDGVNQIAQVVQDNSATSEESAAASQELSSQAELMRNMVSVFELK